MLTITIITLLCITNLFTSIALWFTWNREQRLNRMVMLRSEMLRNFLRNSANARLVIAAPRLLEACKIAKQALDNSQHYPWEILAKVICEAEGLSGMAEWGEE